jgi:hypothetical protein
MTSFAGVTPQEVFLSPPKEAQTGVWWHWMGGQVSKEGIEKDLDWFVRMGISSATIFGMADATVPWAKRIADIPTGIHPYDDEWWRLVKFACAEAKITNDPRVASKAAPRGSFVIYFSSPPVLSLLF